MRPLGCVVAAALAVLAVALPLPAVANDLAPVAASIPASCFPYQPRPSPGVRRQLADQTTLVRSSARLDIVRSLSRADRDDELRRLGVKVVRCGGEDWFDLRELQVRRDELEGAVNFSRLCLDYSLFEDIDLTKAVFQNSLLRGSTFKKVVLNRSDWTETRIDGSEFQECSLTNARLTGAIAGAGIRIFNSQLADANFFGFRGVISMHAGTAQRADFSEAVLVPDADDNVDGRTSFINVDLTGSVFRNAKLTEADFAGSMIDGIDFRDATLERAHLESVRLGSPLRFLRTKLSGAFLGDIDLEKTDVAYIIWSDSGPFVGEERMGDNRSEGRTARIRYYSQAELTYRLLEQKYRQLGYSEEAKLLRFRSKETRSKMLQLSESRIAIGERSLLLLSWWADGYSTIPVRWLGNVLLIIGIFSFAYRLCGTRITWNLALYFSFFYFLRFTAEAVDYRPVLGVLFHTPKTEEESKSITDTNLRYVAAFEAFVGIILMYMGLKCLFLAVGVM